MASPQKQAKQARTIRNGMLKVVETIEVAEGMVNLLIRMAEAEVISQTEMLTILISDPGISTAETLDDEVDLQIVLLKVYGNKIEGRSEDWIEDTGFLAAYAEAARRLGREELIQAWQDAFDF